MPNSNNNDSTDTESIENRESSGFFTYLTLAIESLSGIMRAAKFINRNISGVNPTLYYEFNDLCDLLKMAESHRKEIVKAHKNKGTGLDTWGNDLMCYGQFIIDCQRNQGRIDGTD